VVILSLLLALIFPLDPPVTITSSFGEYRTTHLHGGIDFSTGGKTGLPVHACHEGKVASVRITWRGYGKVLYLDHGDGNTSVYAHLDRFSPAIESRLTEAYRDRGPFPDWVDLKPPVHLKEGDLLGYSGESGEGLPHLHFEVRRSNQPLDPLRLLSYSRGRSPRFESITLIPGGPDTTVNDGVQPTTLTLPIRKPIHVRGPVRVSLTACVESGPSRWGLQDLSARLDGTEIMSMDLSSFSYEWSNFTGFIFQRSRTGFSPTRYTYWITPPENSPVPSMKGSPYLDLTPGNHQLEIVSGKATTTLTLVGSEKPSRAIPLPKNHFEALLDHYIVSSGASAYPERQTVIQDSPLTLGARVDSKTSIHLSPLDVMHREPSPLPLILRLSDTIPPSPSPFLSPVMEILPSDLPLTHPLRVGFQAGSDVDKSRAGLYQWKGRWRPLAGTWKDNRYEADTWIPGKIAAIVDDSPPDISRIMVSGSELTVKVNDALSGLSWNSVKARSGSTTEVLIYDPDHNIARGNLPGRPFEVTATDNAGNTTRRSHK